jgi:hypothetical protein
MDFWMTVKVLLRRWYITVPTFLASLGLAAAAYSLTPVEYESVSVLVLTTPVTGGTAETHAEDPDYLTNPLLSFDHSLALTGSIVIQQMNSSETNLALGVTPGATTSYLATNGTTNPELLESGPFLFIQGKGPSPEAAQDIAERASAMAADVLAQRQTELNAPASTHISIQTVVPPMVGQPLKGNSQRAAASAVAVAGLASLIAVYGFESMMTHRRRRRADTEHATANGVPARRAPSLDLPSPRLVHEVASAPTDHRVDGTSAQATATRPVGVLESPADSTDDTVVDSRLRRVRSRISVSSRAEPTDEPNEGSATEDR